MASTSEHQKVLALLNITDDTEEEQEEDNNEESTNKRKPWNKFINSLFMLLYLLSKSTTVSQPMAYTMTVINTLQLMSFAFLSPQFHWNGTFRETVTPAFRILTFGFLTTKSGSASVAQIAFFVTISLVLLTAGLCIWTGRQVWTTGMVHYLQVLPFLKFTMKLLTTVLYVPALAILIGAFDCSVVNLCSETGIYTVFAVSLATVIVAFVAFNCLVAAVFVNNNPDSESAVSQVHGRADCGYMMLRACLSMIFSLFPNAQSLGLSIVVLTSGILSTGVYLKYMPYLHRRTNRVVVACNSAYMWSGMCLVLAEFLNNSEGNAAFICFLMGLPFVIGLFIMIVILREVSFSEMEPKPNASIYEAELILRYKLKPCAATWSSVSKQYREYVDVMYPNNPFIFLRLASLYSFCGSNSLLAGQYVKRANLASGKSIDHKFFIYRSFKRQQEARSGTAGALNYMTLKHHQLRAEAQIIQSIEQVLMLYKFLASDSCTSDGIFTFARKLKVSSLHAKENLNELIKITQSSPRSLLLYSLYVREIQNDPIMAEKLYKGARSQFKRNKGNGDIESGAVFTLSGDESNIGVILDASDNCEAFFGYSSASLLGKNIDYLCPPPFDSGVHAKLLHHYIETAVSFVPIRRQIWARHIDGYVSRMSLDITPVQEGTGGLSFQGRLNHSLDKVELVAIDTSGTILFFTKKMMSSFGMRVLNSKDFCDADKNICKFIPQMKIFDFKAIAENSQSDVFKQDIDVGQGERYAVSAKPLKFHVINVEIMILEFEALEKLKDIVVESDTDDEQQEEDGASSVSSDTPLDFTSGVETPSQCSDDSGDENKSSYSRGKRRASVVHQVVQNRINAENNRLLKFQRQCAFLGCVFTAMLIFTYLINRFAFLKFDEITDTLTLTAERTYLIIETAVAMLHQLRVIVAQTEEAAELLELVPDTIQINANMLEQIQEQIIGTSSFQNPVQEALMFEPNNVREFLSDGTWDTTSASTLLQRFISNARAFRTENPQECSTSCQWVINNGPWDLVEKSLASMETFKQSALDVFDSNTVVTQILLILAAVIAIAIVYFLIVPPLLDVKRVKEEMTGALSQIPRSALAKLSKSSLNRCETIRQEISRINTGSNPFVGGSKSRKIMNFAAKSNTMMYGSRKGAFVVQDPKSPWLFKWLPNRLNPFGTSAKISPAAENRIGKRNSSASFILSMMKLCLPLFLVVGYFGVVSKVVHDVESDALLRLGAIHATAIRWITIQRMHFSVESPRGDEIEDWSRWSDISTQIFAYQHNETKRSRIFLDLLTAQEEYIVYGKPNISSAVPLISKSTNLELYNLFFVDGCTPVAECMQMKHDNISDILLYDMDFGLDMTMLRMIQRSEGVSRGDEVNGGIFSFVSMFALSAALKHSMQLYIADSVAAEQTASTTILIGTLICFCLVLCVFFFMIRLFKRINDEVVDAQALLLLLPIELVKAVPALNVMLITSG